jgi:hypothetical protein
MTEFVKKGAESQSFDLMSILYEHTCDAEDDRDCSIMKHLILAEIRQSNAPAWVALELEKKLECRGCYSALAKRSVVYPVCLARDRFSADSKGYKPENRTDPLKA